MDCLTEGENWRGHTGRGGWGERAGGAGAHEKLRPGTLGPCRERAGGSLVTEGHLKNPSMLCSFGSSLLLCPPCPLAGEDLYLWVWETWLLMEREEGTDSLGFHRVAWREKHRGGAQRLRDPEPKPPISPPLWVICRNPGEGPGFLGAWCGVSH